MSTPVLPVRPVRPRIPAPELLERAAEYGFPVRDVNDVWLTRDGDLVISSGAGVEHICVPEDRPDGAGQHGVLLHRAAPGYAEPRGSRKFVPRDTGPVNEPWTIADLEWAGRQLVAPAAEGIADGFGGFRSWLFAEDDAPVRAYRLWQEIAKRNRGGITMAEAVANFPTAALCRQLIADSRWLSVDEAAAL
ncbi:hypothetical protein GCM10027176_45800 [Actinoallomurus bryophytorum]|uniref:Uncharacterized protein n=1 Tax=Actinoallomurus bryophytorum TaxID=1490222 RepID=A0A543CCE9_9ACTN|nr:hypothetical protein [Actinoallomurus bryophytorum]TQL94768.1 hypothetical protein FB559_0250 [Actinoallomurus bryophytorum]